MEGAEVKYTLSEIEFKGKLIYKLCLNIEALQIKGLTVHLIKPPAE